MKIFFLRDIKCRLLYLVFLLTVSQSLFSQTEDYGQFWNGYSFIRDINPKWGIDVAGGFRTSSVPGNSSFMSQVTRIHGKAGARCYISKRWTLFASFGYYLNRHVPELSQRKAPELRTSIQANYLMIKQRFRLGIKTGLEDRHLKNVDNYFESVFRLRLQLKGVYPLNGPVIKEKVLYSFLSDEVMLKTKSSVSGSSVFDRNRFNAGFGYSFVNDLQLEVSYVHDLLPRNDRTVSYHVLQANVIFTDFLPNFKKKYKREKTAIEGQ
ncbi:DUF2490 domain-containing protein [Flavobacterium sp. C4GT6]|uniref:DUF2490 domain-containing protein n=1 Tax=Flavobacterium sp. C4GT6 TaxID=3103818 RepID=UPI002ED6B3DC